MISRYIKMILNAKVYDLVQETPVHPMHFLSKNLGNRILVKREDLQSVFSFKIRGAYNRMLHLSASERSRGVIAASAGNHAQGVALAASRLGIHAQIVMPVTTPLIKVQSVRERGGNVVLHGDNFDQACAHALALAKRENFVFIHPYDDPAVIAGQGTIGLELTRQISEPIEAVFIPVGGGGLAAGIAVYLKYVRPEIKIIGVESDSSACLQAALKAGRRVTLPRVGIFADGVAVATIGKEPFRVLQSLIDDVVVVSNDEICAAIKDLFEDTRSIAEPAGALGLAGLKKYAQHHGLKGKTLLTIESGANVNFGRLRYVSQRAEFGEGREILLAATISSSPGSLMAFCQLLHKHNVTELNYRYSSAEAAQILVGLEIRSSGGDRLGIISALQRHGYAVHDLTDNELAKEHVCSMIGGQATGVDNEHLYRFIFPEKSGALMRFLAAMPKRWNISLFNYRNQGSAYASVCVGLQIPRGEQKHLKKFLAKVNYPSVAENDNPAYKLFLRG